MQCESPYSYLQGVEGIQAHVWYAALLGYSESLEGRRMVERSPGNLALHLSAIISLQVTAPGSSAIGIGLFAMFGTS
jgi:hypothetical protein